MKATAGRSQTDGAGECSQELWMAVSFSQPWLASHGLSVSPSQLL